MPPVCCNDMDWIIPGVIAIGNMDAVANSEFLLKHGIRGVVTVRENLTRTKSFYKSNGINILHINVADAPTTKLYLHFSEVFNFIDKILKTGGAVIVNCYAGISRSTSIVTSYLMRKKNWTALHAMSVVRQARPCFNPNKGFIQQIHNYEIALQRHGFMLL